MVKRLWWVVLLIALFVVVFDGDDEQPGLVKGRIWELTGLGKLAQP